MTACATIPGVNPLDAGAIALVVLAILLGWRSGALPQVGGLGGAVLGVVAGFAAVPWLLDAVADAVPLVRVAIVLLLLIGCFGIGEALGTRLGDGASRLLGTGLLGALDRVTGAIVGAGQAVLILWLVGGILATGVIPSLAATAQASKAVRAISVILPPPTAIVLELGKALDASGLPDVFLGLERLPAEPIDLPNEAFARALGAAAASSVFRVRADACAIRSTGTGFAVAAGYVVTSAHVVAGARSIVIETADDDHAAVAVLFNPVLDLALLRIEGLVAPTLIFARGAPTRGDAGATFGYPDGGAAAASPAVVTAVYDAEGLDITGTARVTRRIVEVRAIIEPGDSGGPLLLANGTVGGLVFAESRSDESVGYALSPTDVAVAVMPAIGRTRAVDLGPCLR
jgi:S1-C subfamily serine protease